jgi:hypothetical protein
MESGILRDEIARASGKRVEERRSVLNGSAGLLMVIARQAKLTVRSIGKAERIPLGDLRRRSRIRASAKALATREVRHFAIRQHERHTRGAHRKFEASSFIHACSAQIC